MTAHGETDDQAKHPSTPAGGLRRRSAAAALRLYPRAWRQRYGVEVAALLAVHPIRVATMISLLVGAADAHLHPDLFRPADPCGLRRARWGHLVACCATALFTVALLTLQQVHEPEPGWRAATGHHPAVRVSFDVGQLAGVVAMLAGLGGFVLVTGAVARATIASRNPDILRSLRRGAVLVCTWLALSATIAAIASHRPGSGIRPLRPVDLALEWLWFGATALTAVSAAALAWRALAAGKLRARAARAARTCLAVTAAAMAVSLIATLVSAVLLVRSHTGVISSGWATAIAVAMAAAAALAGAAYRGTAPAVQPSTSTGEAHLP
jgi:hypothetical protein